MPDKSETLHLPAPSTAHRDVPLSSRGHFTGHIVIGDAPGRVVQTESHLEFEWCLCLIARPETADLREQVAFDWRDEAGKRHTHFFDFVVTQTDGQKIAYAVRPEIRTGGKFGTTMPLIALQAKQQRFVSDVRLLTDTDLDPVELRNARLLHGMRVPDATADDAARVVVAEMSGVSTLGDLSERIGLGADGFRALVRLLRSHHLRTVWRELITPTTKVYKAEIIQ